MIIFIQYKTQYQTLKKNYSIFTGRITEYHVLNKLDRKCTCFLLPAPLHMWFALAAASPLIGTPGVVFGKKAWECIQQVNFEILVFLHSLIVLFLSDLYSSVPSTCQLHLHINFYRHINFLHKNCVKNLLSLKLSHSSTLQLSSSPETVLSGFLQALNLRPFRGIYFTYSSILLQSQLLFGPESDLLPFFQAYFSNSEIFVPGQ